MADFFNTGNVNVFPSSYRTSVAQGKYTSEQNFVNILNSIVDKKSYVLSTNESLIEDENRTLRVVIHGYYFEVLHFNPSSYNNLFFAINVEQGASALVNFDTMATSEKSLDEGGLFKGLAYSTSEFIVTDTDDNKFYTLQVVKDGKLVNQIRLSSNSVYYKGTEDTVSTKLDSKQANLSAGLGIDPEKLADNEVSLTSGYNATLDSMKERVGMTTQPIYINNGTAHVIEGSSGTTQKSKDNYTYTQSALITGGILQTNGVTFYASQDSPTNDVGQNGDFWFKYSA